MTTINNKMNATTENENANKENETPNTDVPCNVCRGEGFLNLPDAAIECDECDNYGRVPAPFHTSTSAEDAALDDIGEQFVGEYNDDIGAAILEIEKRWEMIDAFYLPDEKYGKCCICKGWLSNEWGNNPQPIKKRGKCCEKCNHDKVLPARMGGMFLMGSHEEQVLQSKVMGMFGKVEGSPTTVWIWEMDYEPFNKIKREYRDVVIARGVFPLINYKGDEGHRNGSISFQSISEMMVLEWDKQNSL